MITLKEANSIWLEALALYQSVLTETLDEWGKPEEEEVQKMLAKVVQGDPDLLARAQREPEVKRMLEQYGG